MAPSPLRSLSLEAVHLLNDLEVIACEVPYSRPLQPVLKSRLGLFGAATCGLSKAVKT